MDLGDDREPLIVGERARKRRQRRELVACEHRPLHVRARIGNLGAARLLLADSELERTLESCVRGRATSDRATAIVDAGEEALLEHALGMDAARERSPAPDARNELERRLREAFLEVVGAKPMPVDAEEDRPLCGDGERNQLSRVVARRGSLAAGVQRRQRALATPWEWRLERLLRGWTGVAGS